MQAIQSKNVNMIFQQTVIDNQNAIKSLRKKSWIEKTEYLEWDQGIQFKENIEKE